MTRLQALQDRVGELKKQMKLMAVCREDCICGGKRDTESKTIGLVLDGEKDGCMGKSVASSDGGGDAVEGSEGSDISGAEVREEVDEREGRTGGEESVGVDIEVDAGERKTAPSRKEGGVGTNVDGGPDVVGGSGVECGGEIEVAAGSGAASDVAKVGAPAGVDAGVAKDKRDKGVQTDVTSSLVSSYAQTVVNGLVKSGEVKSQTYPSRKEKKGEKVKAGHQSGV